VTIDKPVHTFSRGYLIALCSSAILSTTAVFIRYLTQTYQLPALVLAFWRDIFVFLTLLLVFIFLQKRLLIAGTRNLGFLALYGLGLAMFNALWTLSVALNGAAVATVLVYCSAAFTALLGWWILKERLDWGKILAILFCLSGCVLVAGVLSSNAWSSNLVGIATGIISGLGYAIYSLMGRAASQRGINPWTTLFYTFGFAALFLLALNLVPSASLPGKAAQMSDFFWLGREWTGWGILFLLAALPTVAGFGLYNVSLGYLSASVANLILTTEPVFTAVSAYFLLGEVLTPIQVFGSLMILTGVVVLRISEGKLVKRGVKGSVKEAEIAPIN
jgi:drug/metabolite transporter (DMT)-like permease